MKDEELFFMSTKKSELYNNNLTATATKIIKLSEWTERLKDVRLLMVSVVFPLMLVIELALGLLYYTL